jgi:hypothetical protein
LPMSVPTADVIATPLELGMGWPEATRGRAKTLGLKKYPLGTFRSAS